MTSQQEGREQLLRLMEKNTEQSVYQEYITNNRYSQGLKHQIDRKYNQQQDRATLATQQKTLLGDNHSLF